MALAATLILTRLPGPGTASASSHSEAPLISQDPRADNTDLYAFVSPENTNTVTMIANYIPLEAPASGPNFYSFDDSVLYEIKIDNNGDGAADIGYQFRFHDATRNPNTFLYNTGPITSLERRELEPAADLRRHARPLQEGRQGREGGKNSPSSSARTCRRRPTTSGRARRRTTTRSPRRRSRPPGDGVKVFAGQRDDPFFVDLGSIFDLAGLRPFNPFHLIPLAAGPGGTR